jgi:NAD(P)-dependent dehydrogenase (short-subunit alcohol dehydrogenase family)
MLSEAAFTTPPAPAGAGGWGVAYAAAKAAFHRVTDMCHVEFFSTGVWAFSIAPGLTLTESMRASGMDQVLVGAGHRPAPPEVAGEVAAWLGTAPDAVRYAGQMVSSRALCKELGLVGGWPAPRA